MEGTQVSNSRGMGKKNGLDTLQDHFPPSGRTKSHSQQQSGYNQRYIVLNEPSQFQKDKCHLFLLICRASLLCRYIKPVCIYVLRIELKLSLGTKGTNGKEGR